MTKGIIYYNVGTKCLIRLFTSIHSLRNHWNGPVSLIYEGDIFDWVVDLLKKYKIDLIKIPDDDVRLSNALSRKPFLHRWSPYDLTVFLDADTVILANPEPLFDTLQSKSFFTTWFAGWLTKGKKISRRIESWKPALPYEDYRKAMNYGKAVNTGVFGFRKDSKFLPRWEEMTVIGNQHKCTMRLLDELACQVILHEFPKDIAILGGEWNKSVRHDPKTEPKIMHYHGSKHVMEDKDCEIWKNTYHQMVAYNHEYRRQLSENHGDRRFSRWLGEGKHDLFTVVTAVNKPYLAKLKKNWNEWKKIPYIIDNPMVVFYNELKEQDLQFIKHPNLRLVEWQFPQAGDNIRERMLSAFVFGVPQHVSTLHWMKLDCDCTPKSNELMIPENRLKRYDLIGHRWHYTKVKSDERKQNWLVLLDNWWKEKTGEEPLFPDADINQTKFRHRRLCTFVAFEKLSHTKDIVKMCGDDEQLPIPSQDTVSWYVATRMKKRIKSMDMKKYWSPRS